MQRTYFLYSFVACIVFWAFTPISSNNLAKTIEKNGLDIEFSNHVGNTLLHLDTIVYKNELNQNFTVTKFKYYIGNITIFKKNGTLYKSDKYFLIDEEKTKSKTISLENIPTGEYLKLTFTLGVDSIDNCSGAQTGALDPINGMFWTWNTGYIFMKLEGISEYSTSPNSIFEYHIGGFKNPYNCVRTISLSFDNALSISTQHREKIKIKTDILEILKKPKSIDFSELSSVTNFNNSQIIADNYADMFTRIKVQNEK